MERPTTFDRKNIEHRFGSIAIKKGFVTESQVNEAINMQAQQDTDKREHRLIGSILYSMGYLTISQVDEVLEEMNKPAD